MGAELGPSSAIFTSQAWNMAFSLPAQPQDLDGAARLPSLAVAAVLAREVLFAMPGLV
jgi:ABC-type anion transport system duplicated permease subunit